MEKETLTEGNTLLRAIQKFNIDIDSLKLQLKATEKGYYGEKSISMEVSFFHRDPHELGQSQKTVSVGFTVTRDALLKQIRRSLYVAENLLKKSEKELERL